MRSTAAWDARISNGSSPSSTRPTPGTRTPRASTIPRVTLPPRYSFGDNFHSLDLRLSRSFVIRRRLRVSLIGEAFNVYNAANLSGHSGDLTSAAFGQPTSRVTQVFGSGGPRPFNLRRG